VLLISLRVLGVKICCVCRYMVAASVTQVGQNADGSCSIAVQVSCVVVVVVGMVMMMIIMLPMALLLFKSTSPAIQGWIRGREWQVNNLVHIAGAGVYQLQSARLLPDPCPTSHPPRAAAAAGGGGAAGAAAEAPTELRATAAGERPCYCHMSPRHCSHS
jgi:hypothetical protein